MFRYNGHTRTPGSDASCLVLVSNRIKRLRRVSVLRYAAPSTRARVLWIYNSRLPQPRTSQSGLSVNVMSHRRYPSARESTFGFHSNSSVSTRDLVFVSFGTQFRQPTPERRPLRAPRDLRSFTERHLSRSSRFLQNFPNFVSFGRSNMYFSRKHYNSTPWLVATTPTPIVTTRKVGLAIRAARASKRPVLHFFLSPPLDNSERDLERPSIVDFTKCSR